MVTTRGVLAVFGSLSLLGCGGFPGLPDDGASVAKLAVEVDLRDTQGDIRDVFGVNKAPTLSMREAGGSLNAAKLYSSFNVSQARLHDVGIEPCSIYTDATVLDHTVSPPVVVQGCSFANIVRRRTWTVNDATKVDEPANYDFSRTDMQLAAAVQSGAKVYLRLNAQDYGGPNDTEDVESFARVSVNIYRHVIGKFKPGPVALDPAFIEVGNEPDGAFWRGTASDFTDSYNLVVDGVREAALKEGKTVTVGGSGFTDGLVANFSKPDNVANGFAAAVTRARLEFVSAHHYDECSAETLSAAATSLTTLRSTLDAQGMKGIPLHLSEWNIGLGNKCTAEDFTSAQGQSFASGMLTLMQDDSLDVGAAHYYSGVPPMSLFQHGDAVADGISVSPSAWALRAHGELRGGTQVKAEVCPRGEPCVSGVAGAGAPVVAVAGRLASGGHRVIVTNDSDTEQQFALRVSGLGTTSATAKVRRPPSSQLVVAGSVTGQIFTPSDEGISALLANETVTESVLTFSGSVGRVVLTAPARGMLVVELP